MIFWMTSELIMLSIRPVQMQISFSDSQAEFIPSYNYKWTQRVLQKCKLYAHIVARIPQFHKLILL